MKANCEEKLLLFERFPYFSLTKTYNTNAQTPDSAGTMTAMMTGIRTRKEVLSVDESTVRGDHTTHSSIKTLLKRAEARRLSTGVVSIARLTHATPAACYAHSPDRNWEDDSQLPPEAALDDFPDIARQLVEFHYGDGLEVALGGGQRHFLPTHLGGRRLDGRDLTEEWLDQSTGNSYVTSSGELQAIDPNEVGQLLGLFGNSHMNFEADRLSETDANKLQPSLAEMTSLAIDVLDNNDQGYFLHVEAGRIDHAHHEGNAKRSLLDTIAFSQAVQAAVDNTNADETLIIVTADHSHVFTIGGYPARGNDILGKVAGADGLPSLAADGKPYTTLSYANGPGHTNAERPDLSQVDTAALGYRQQAAVPLSSESHSAEDVSIYALGPNAHLFRGTKEQNYIYHVMADALGMHQRRHGG